jgi:hypothetical protein
MARASNLLTEPPSEERRDLLAEGLLAVVAVSAEPKFSSATPDGCFSDVTRVGSSSSEVITRSRSSSVGLDTTRADAETVATDEEQKIASEISVVIPPLSVIKPRQSTDPQTCSGSDSKVDVQRSPPQQPEHGSQILRPTSLLDAKSFSSSSLLLPEEERRESGCSSLAISASTSDMSGEPRRSVGEPEPIAIHGEETRRCSKLSQVSEASAFESRVSWLEVRDCIDADSTSKLRPRRSSLLDTYQTSWDCHVSAHSWSAGSKPNDDATFVCMEDDSESDGAADSGEDAEIPERCGKQRKSSLVMQYEEMWSGARFRAEPHCEGMDGQIVA